MKKKWIPAVLAVALVLLAVWGVVRWRNSGADNVAPYTVMVDGALYHTYGEEAPAPEADEISGQISARFVAGSVLPKEEGTSNFDECVGQPYAFVNGELLLYYGGQWNRCVPAEVHQLDPT